MTRPRRFGDIEPPKTPLWFKLWFAFCGLAGLTVLGVVVWAIIKLVNRYA